MITNATLIVDAADGDELFVDMEYGYDVDYVDTRNGRTPQAIIGPFDVWYAGTDTRLDATLVEKYEDELEELAREDLHSNDPKGLQ